MSQFFFGTSAEGNVFMSAVGPMISNIMGNASGSCVLEVANVDTHPIQPIVALSVGSVYVTSGKAVSSLTLAKIPAPSTPAASVYGVTNKQTPISPFDDITKLKLTSGISAVRPIRNLSSTGSVYIVSGRAVASLSLVKPFAPLTSPNTVYTVTNNQTPISPFDDITKLKLTRGFSGVWTIANLGVGNRFATSGRAVGSLSLVGPYALSPSQLRPSSYYPTALRAIPTGVNRYTATFGRSAAVAPERFDVSPALLGLAIGHALQTSVTTIYVPPVAGGAVIRIFVSNIDTVSRTFRLYLYPLLAGASDANSLTPTITLAAGDKIKIGPVYLPDTYGVYGVASVNDKIVAIPMGKEDGSLLV